MNRFVCAQCYGKFASKKYRVGEYHFCSRLCKNIYEHGLKERDRKQKEWSAFLYAKP